MNQTLLPIKACPSCGSEETRLHRRYATHHNGVRELHECAHCRTLFSETKGTPMQGLKSPISKVAGVLRVRSEGLGLRATARCFGVHKNTVTQWEHRFAEQKAPLMLYAVCHEFIRLTFEGDELYTVVGKRGAPCDSQGWTVVILERASRFIVEQRCGEKDEAMFRRVMGTVADYLKQSEDLTFLSDGERRYGNWLFELCAEQIRTGQRGRPPKALPPNVKVRLKNKGARNTNPRPKYEAPHREHPDTPIPRRTWRRRTSTPTMLRRKMRRYADATARFDDEPTPMPSACRAYSARWMFTKSFTTLSAATGPPARFPQLRWAL